MEYIRHIRNKKNGEELPLHEFEVRVIHDEVKHIDVHHLYRNGVFIKKHNKLEVGYVCKTCQRVNIVCMTNMLRKFNKKVFDCVTCRESSGVEISLLHKLQRDQEIFDAMDEEFKKEYFRHHHTVEEFHRLQGKIVSFHHDKFVYDKDRFDYFPCVGVQNGAKFAPFVYDKQRDILEKMAYIRYLCDNCGVCFENKELHQQKNKYKVLCKECCFTNNTVKLKTDLNYLGQNIVYKTKFDLKFIRYCNKHGVVIENGPDVTYTTPEGIEKMFKITFQVPHKDMWVEFKSQKFWHDRHAIEKGIKEQTLFAHAEKAGKKYMIVYPCEYVKFCKSLQKV